jgi:3-methylcrotonyl-CoA carboxylase alpha subunit
VFDKLLIANRGEIACRVMETARRMGVRTVAVYSEADADSRHVAMADEAWLIGEAPAAKSYLDPKKIIDVAKKSGAGAIHPGYGFLSENAEFAEACQAAGIAFIGPNPDGIRAMGLKDAAKAIMEKAGVPVVPGYHEADQSPDVLKKAAGEIGYPVLIKAVAGGGGKGMRQVHSEADFEEALEGAQREGKAAFGDDRVLIEKYLTKPRHIEIQVFGDASGEAVHLFERDCSLQRRHQKVIEEAPAPDMPLPLREKMGQAAVQAAKAIGYVGAGTVEFIVDVSEGLGDSDFFFMEMNTRLQVEHPVTEMITGHDLVEWQLRVAAGETLPVTQADLAINGHAIEVRLYAEDPSKNFLPSTGTLSRLRLGLNNPHVRIDTGVREGDEVTVHYDPMIAKLIVWDADRPRALRRLRAALDECQIAGLNTNAAFLTGIAAHPAFVGGDLDTGFIERHSADLIPETGAASDRVLALATLDQLLRQAAEIQSAAHGSDDPHSPWNSVSGWAPNVDTCSLVKFIDGDDEVTVTVHYQKNGYVFDLPGGSVSAQGEIDDEGNLVAVIDGARALAAVAQDGFAITVMSHGAAHRLSLDNPLDIGDLEDAAGGKAVSAPMSGKIIQVLAAPGDTVKKGAPMIILEAMKMEQTLGAPVAGVVAEVNVEAGEQVDEGAVLVSFEESEK